MKISPSILNADFGHLEKEINSIKKANYIHLDIMDGHFVPNISFGPAIAKTVSDITKLPLDIHLMLKRPIDYIDKFIFHNTEFITVHYEIENLDETIRKIKDNNIKVGLSIKPKTEVKEIEKYLSDIDLVLVMSVEPGFGGQAFIDTAYDKISQLLKIKEKKCYNFIVEVDGGIDLEIAKRLKELGTDIIVVGSYLFKNKDKEATLNKLLSI